MRDAVRWGMIVGLSAGLLAGCGGDDADGADGGVTDGPVRGTEDARVLRDSGPATDIGPGVDPDAAPTSDATRPQDSGVLRTVRNCEDVCGIYDECGQLEANWPNGIPGCLAACAAAEGSPRYPGYVACLQVTQDCAQLGDCSMPRAPLPSCAEICAANEACPDDFRLPAGLQGLERCLDACQDGVLATHISECGAQLREAGEDACDEPAFSHCVLARVRTAEDCLALCERQAPCVDGGDVVDCTLSCLTTAPPEDPVARRRQDQRRDCIRRANDCEAVVACREIRTGEIEGRATVAELCAADACAFFDAERCEEAATGALRPLQAGAVDCLAEQLAGACDASVVSCFVPGRGPDAVCEEHCLLSELCGQLPEGINEFACVEACQAARRSDSPEARAEFEPLFACVNRGTCAELIECQSTARPERACADLCDRRVECGLAEAEACVAECEASFSTTRSRAERACVAAAATCEAAARCQALPPPDCAEHCVDLVACGLAGADCAARCDNDGFADRGGLGAQLACVGSSGRCDDRAACLMPPTTRGRDCLGYCRATVTCAGGGVFEEEACISACSRGRLAPADEIERWRAAACLVAAQEGGDCAVLSGCLGAADPTDACAAFCDEQARCRLLGAVPEAPEEPEEPVDAGVPEDADAGVVEDAGSAEDAGAAEDAGEPGQKGDDVDPHAACLAACEASAGDEDPDLAPLACVIRVIDRRAGCGPVAECVGAQVEPASAACVGLCGALNGCDDDVDRFLCERDCVPEPEGTGLRAVCAGLADCATLDRCLEAPAQPPVACGEACEALDACPDAVGPDGVFADAETCLLECGGRAALFEAAYVERVGACVTNAECDAEALTACFERPETLCDDAWLALVACGMEAILGGGDQALFLAECRQNIATNGDVARQQAQCMIDASAAAGGDFFGCIAGMAGCFL